MFSPAFLRASDIYDFAVCPHRVWLDRRLPRSARSQPDEARRILLHWGLEWEAQLAERLGFLQPQYPPGAFQQGALVTLDLMKTGVPGIYQPVFFRENRLAIPDLIQRVEGASELGPFHYIPGDIKTGRMPRTDQVLQLSFASWVLGQTQGVEPQAGFLWLGDDHQEVIDLEAIRLVSRAAGDQLAEFISSESASEPFFDLHCRACRWVDRCLPEMVQKDDLSLVDGMTRARRSILQRIGIHDFRTLAQSAAALPDNIHLPAAGLERLRFQAQTLVSRTPRLLQPSPFPHPKPGDLLIHLESDPLSSGQIILLASSRFPCPPNSVEVVVPDDSGVGFGSVSRWVQSLVESGARLFFFGNETFKGLDQILSVASTPPQQHDTVLSQTLDLLRCLKRAGAFFPVWRYTAEEIDAALQQPSVPFFAHNSTPAFVFAANRRHRLPGPWSEALHAHGVEAIERLSRITQWLMDNAGETTR